MGNRRLFLDEDVRTMIKLYVDENRSIPQVAKIMGWGATTIARRLKLAGVKIKSQSEVMSGRKLTQEHREKVVRTLHNGLTGRDNPNWKGGRSIKGRTDAKYVLIRVDNKYVPEHRHVVEQHLGRKLVSSEQIHHINGIRTDNRLKNLQILSNSEHAKLHNSDPAFRKRKSDKMKKIRAERFWSSRYL